MKTRKEGESQRERENDPARERRSEILQSSRTFHERPSLRKPSRASPTSKFGSAMGPHSFPRKSTASAALGHCVAVEGARYGVRYALEGLKSAQKSAEQRRHASASIIWLRLQNRNCVYTK